MERLSSVLSGAGLVSETPSDAQREEPPTEKPKRQPGIFFGDEFWNLAFRTIGSPGEIPNCHQGLQQLRRALETDLVSDWEALVIKSRIQKAVESWLRKENGRKSR